MSDVTKDFMRLVEMVASGKETVEEAVKAPDYREIRRRFMKLPEKEYQRLLRIYHDTAKNLPMSGNLKSKIIKAVENEDRVEVWNALVEIEKHTYQANDSFESMVLNKGFLNDNNEFEFIDNLEVDNLEVDHYNQVDDDEDE